MKWISRKADGVLNSCVVMQADGVEDAGDADDGAVEERPDSVDVLGGKKERKITNQFNFSERASQTLNNPQRVSFSLVQAEQSCAVKKGIKHLIVNIYKAICFTFYPFIIKSNVMEHPQ